MDQQHVVERPSYRKFRTILKLPQRGSHPEQSTSWRDLGLLLLWQGAAIVLLVLACWHIGRLCFNSVRARWGGVVLVAALLTIPVAGTSLYIMDQYLNTRSLSAPAVLFAIVNAIEHKWKRAG